MAAAWVGALHEEAERFVATLFETQASYDVDDGTTYCQTGFARKVGSLAVLVSLRISVYLCVLCVKTFAPIYLTQSTQRYAEKVPQT